MGSVSLREFARQMGVSHEAVRRARDSGRIVVNHDGTVNPKTAARAWRANTLHSRRHAVRARSGEEARAREDWLRARVAREAIQARLADLDLKVKRGELVPADQVRREAFETARRFRDLLLALPGRIGSEISALSPEEATRLLQQEVARLCAELPGEP